MSLRFKFSLFALLSLVTVCGIVFSLAFKKITLKQNQLLVQIDEDWKCYDVISAAYGIHQEGTTHFLTVSCSAENEDLDPDNCFLEFSIPFQTQPKGLLKPGAKFDVPDYDPKHGNLNFFYYLGYGDIDEGVFLIRDIDESEIDGVLLFNGGAVRLRATFEDSGITRSFS